MSKKDLGIVPGLRYTLKVRHDVLLTILEVRGQTQAEAAAELGISVSALRNYIDLKTIPRFDTERGKALAKRFEDWSELPEAEYIFPETVFTRKFLQAPKKHQKRVAFNLISSGVGKENWLPPLLALPAPSVADQPAFQLPAELPAPRKQRKKKRKAKK